MLLCLHYIYLAFSLSHEAKKLLQSARANIVQSGRYVVARYIFLMT